MYSVSAARDAVPVSVAGAAFQRELWGWSALAVGSLAIAGLFALLLAVSRVPGIEAVFPWPLGFFRKGLVIHVVFSFVVWFLAVFGAMLHVATSRLAGGAPRAAGLGMTAIVGTTAALPLLFLPAFFDRGEATLNNYIPVIIDPLYYTGLVVLGVSLALAALRLLVNRPNRVATAGPPTAAMAGVAVLYLVALVCFSAAYRFLIGQSPSHTFNDALLWGGAHLLQFVNTALLVIAWSILCARIVDRPVVPRGVLFAAVGLLVLFGLPAPVFYGLFQPFSEQQTNAFTNLQYALGPPALLVAAAAARPRLWPRPLPWYEPAFLCVVLSMLVFFVGGALGLFVDGADTRTPAHYHGVIAGVTLAFMGLFYAVFLPLLGRSVAPGKWVRAQIHLFAWGQLTACLGLFSAGGFGAPRKVAGAAQGLDAVAAKLGMAMNGLGGLVAVIGGILFIGIVGKALLHTPEHKTPPSERLLRLW